MKTIGLLCVVSLLILPAPGLAEKGGGRGNPEQRSAEVTATFADYVEGRPAKIQGDGAPYSRKGRDAVDVGIFNGYFHLSFTPESTRAMFFNFDELVEGSLQGCYTYPGENPTELPAPAFLSDPSKLSLTKFHMVTSAENIPDGSGGWQGQPGTFNLLSMTDGETRYLGTRIDFFDQSWAGQFDIRYNETQLIPIDRWPRGIVQVTAYGSGPDKWVFRPIQDATLFAIPGNEYAAQLYYRDDQSQPAIACSYGNFIMPFELTVERAQRGRKKK
jgi:hypothetical protein